MASVKRGQLTIVLNREAGTLASLGPEEVEAGLREILAAMGCGVEILNGAADKIEETLRQALRGEADAVIVGGGDGTVATAATIFAGQEEYHGNWLVKTFRTLIDTIRSSLDAGYFTVHVSKHRTRLVVPGNHDVQGSWNFWERFLSPFRNYRNIINAEMEPVWSEPGLIVTGANSARPAGWNLDWSRGRISRRQVSRMAGLYGKVNADDLRVLVVHHPLAAPPDGTLVKLMQSARN